MSEETHEAEELARAYFEKVLPHLSKEEYYKDSTKSMTMQAFLAGRASLREDRQEHYEQAKQQIIFDAEKITALESSLAASQERVKELENKVDGLTSMNKHWVSELKTQDQAFAASRQWVEKLCKRIEHMAKEIEYCRVTYKQNPTASTISGLKEVADARSALAPQEEKDG